MVHRWLVVASLLAATTAYAQAPGETAPLVPGYAPTAAPGETPPSAPPPAAPSVMDNRWSVALAVGGLGVTPKDQSDSKTEFSTGELALRYRATLHLEVELALGGGDQKADAGMDAANEVDYAAIALRYRLWPEHAWNAWLSAGFGGLAITPHGADDQARQDARRSLAELGFGVERRFTHFALHAELRAIGLSEVDAAKTEPVAGVVDGPNMPAPAPPPGAYAPVSAAPASAAQLTIGASYYF